MAELHLQPAAWTELLAAAIAICAASILACRATGWLDRPDHRKQHRGAVPLAGGIAISGTYLYGSVALGLPVFTPQTPLVLAAVFLLGMLDDGFQLRPALRLLLHYAAGIAMAVLANIEIHRVGDLLAVGDIALLLLSVPLTALSFAGLANAYNMIDGIDGLAAATAAIPLVALAALAHHASSPMAHALTAVLVGLGVFACFNLGPDTRWLPRIFLGDAGSVTLGFFVCASLVYFSQGAGAVIEPVTALWLVALPLMDMLATMLGRWRAGAHPMAADRSHLHHRLMGFGLGPRQTLLLLGLWSLCCAALGLGLEAAPDYLSFLLYLLLFGGHCAFSLNAERMTPLIRRWLDPAGSDLARGPARKSAG